MGNITSLKQDSNDSQTQQIYHYSQIHLKSYRPYVIYQRPQAKLQTNFLTKYSSPYIQSNEQLSTYLMKLQKYGNLVDPENLFFPVYCEIQKKGSICKQQKLINSFYEIYDYSLKMQINARKKLNQIFLEQQVWFIIISVLNGIKQFQKFKISSGDLKTQTIKMNQLGHIKIRNILTSYTQENNFGIKTFYDQVLLQKLRFNNSHNIRIKSIHSNVAQTFALGVIILQVCTFVDGNSFYDTKNMKFNQAVFQRALKFTQSKYSLLLYNLIQVMLSSHKDRPLPSQIYQVFLPFKDQINNLKPFNLDTKGFSNSIYQSRQINYR